MLNVSLSHKLRVVSFLATIMVVYRHSLNYLAFFNTYSGEGVNGWVQDGIMRLTQIAVPYFFVISGFFFFRKNYYLKDNWMGMIKTKFKTLFIPFAIWNVVGLLTLIATKQKFHISFHDFFMSEWYGPLWYVRDLMTYMLIIPLYQWLFISSANLMRNRLTGVFLSVLFIILIYIWSPVDTMWLSSEGIFFFVLGGILQKREDLLEKKIPTFLFVCMILLWVSMSFCHLDFFLFQKVRILCGIVAFWVFLDYVKCMIIDKFLSYSFIIYVLHFYMIKIMKVGIAKLFYGNDIVSMLSFLFLPLICVLLIILLAKVMERIVPVFYKISTGGR